MIIILVDIIHLISRLLIFLIIVDVVLAYVISPYHPVRQFLDRFLAPLISPIRRVVPTVGMFDFSPVILLILVQLVDIILTNILLSLR
jgi:YggT family protein